MRQIVIDLRDPPRSGGTQVIFRCLAQDKVTITEAAHILLMTEAQFMRTVTIIAARKIVEANRGKITTPPTRGSAVLDDDEGFDSELPPGME